MANSIARLVRLRGTQTNVARRELATAIGADEAAAAHLATARQSLLHEATLAPGDAAHPLITAYAAWLPAAQAELQRIAAEQALAASALTSARRALSDARVAMRACETVAANLAQARNRDAQIREQWALEDCGRRGSPAHTLLP